MGIRERESDIMKNIIIQEKASVNAIGEHINGNSKQVLCINNGIIYASAKDAAKETNCSLSEVSRCCRNLREHTKGNKFCYVSNLASHLNEISESLRKYSVIAAEQEAGEKRKKAIAKAKENYIKAQENYAKAQEKLEKAASELEVLNCNVVEMAV